MTSGANSKDGSRCIYCGKSGRMTSDHVPPRTLFPTPAPKNLITVPACGICNRAFSKDDEFFRLAVVMDEKTKGNPAREALLPGVKRSLLRFRGQGLANSFWSSTQSALRFTPEGLFAGQGILFSTDGKRLERTATRIVQGLYFHEFGEPVPPDHATTVIHPQRLHTADEVVHDGITEFVAATRNEPEHPFGSAFSYWMLRSPNGPHRAHFLLQFYGAVEYYGQVQPLTYAGKEQAQAIEGLKDLYRERGWIPPEDP